MDYSRVFDMLASRYSFVTPERFLRFTNRNIYFLVDAASDGLHAELEMRAALAGRKLKKKEDVKQNKKMSKAEKDKLDEIALETLKRLSAQRKA